MEEENVQQTGTLGKFKSVDALVHAYEELEAEFTRRSQRLKALEREKEPSPAEGKGEASPGERDAEPQESEGEALYRAVSENEQVRARLIEEYLRSLKGVPLLMGSGRGVTAPADRPGSIAEAGALALGYLKSIH